MSEDSSIDEPNPSWETLSEGDTHAVSRIVDHDGDVNYNIELYNRCMTLFFHDPRELLDLIHTLNGVHKKVSEDAKAVALRVCSECGEMHDECDDSSDTPTPEVGH